MSNKTAIQYLAMIMKAEKFKLDYVLQIVEIINNSYLSAKDIIQVLEEIFKNEKSLRILVAVNVLEYLIKNCNRNFHQAANRQSFQKSLLSLLKRQRGKSNIFKEMRSNTQNWSRIEAKVLYFVQLWYDAFILEESKYPYIINTYKILRKQNVVFPPRNTNEKNLLAIQTQSPIFQNIQTIAETDRVKFNKRLRAMGMAQIRGNEQIPETKKPVVSSYFIDIDDISEKIAIIRSQEFEGENVLGVVEKLKKDLQFGKIKPEFKQYWPQIRSAAEMAISEWQEKNAELVKQNQQKFLENKMNKLAISHQKQEQPINQIFSKQQNPPKQPINLLDDWQPQEPTKKEQQQKNEKITQSINLLDL